MRRWDAMTDGYLRWCEAQGLAKSTLAGRTRELDRLGTWLKRRRPRPMLENVGTETLAVYVGSRTRFHAKATVCGVMSHVKGMGEHLVREGIWTSNPMRWMQGPKLDARSRLPRRIGPAQMQALWEAAATQRQEYARALDLALLSVLYGTGARRGEIERLMLADWIREEGVIRFDGRKTGQERKTPLPVSVIPFLEAYLPLRHNLLERLGLSQERALFVGSRGRRLSGDRMGQRVHRLARRAKVPLVTLHQFRHSCASDLMEVGQSVPKIQGILGHAAPGSTLRYLDVSDPARRRAMKRHPINEILRDSAGGREFAVVCGAQEGGTNG